jgi:5'-nucleotidase
MQMRIEATLVSTLALAACATTPSSTAEAPAPALVELQLLGLNDFHGNIEVPGSTTSYRHGEETLREVLGGAARLGATLDGLRAGQPHSLTVAAGDLIGASPFVSANFLDEPAIMALNLVQLDIASVGNHEFDRGIAELQRIQLGNASAMSSAIAVWGKKKVGIEAQRDLIDLTLIEAARRGGQQDLADALRRERAMPMP